MKSSYLPHLRKRCPPVGFNRHLPLYWVDSPPPPRPPNHTPVSWASPFPNPRCCCDFLGDHFSTSQAFLPLPPKKICKFSFFELLFSLIDEKFPKAQANNAFSFPTQIHSENYQHFSSGSCPPPFLFFFKFPPDLEEVSSHSIP